MDEALQILIAILSTGGLGLGVWLFARRLQARKAERLAAALAAQGWKIEPIHQGRTRGYRFSGGEGESAWTLESTFTSSSVDTATGGSGGGGRSTVWRTPKGALDEGMVLVGPRAKVPSMESLGPMEGFLGALVKKALEMMLGQDAQWFEGLAEQPVGSAEFRARFMVWAHDEASARDLLSFEVDWALREWPAKKGPLIVKATSRGIQVEVQGHQLEDAPSLVALVALGDRLLAARLSSPAGTGP